MHRYTLLVCMGRGRAHVVGEYMYVCGGYKYVTTSNEFINSLQVGERCGIIGRVDSEGLCSGNN